MKNEQKRLVIRSGNVFDSHRGIIRDDQAIVICNGRITWVGDENSFEKEPNDNIIDGTNKTILPGLIDCHLHLSGNASIEYEREYLRTRYTTPPQSSSFDQVVVLHTGCSSEQTSAPLPGVRV